MGCWLIDGPKMLKTMHTYPLLFRGVRLIRGGVETRGHQLTGH